MTDAIVQDLRSAVRRIRRSPGLASVVVLTLALGIGANTAIFSIARTVLFEPVPYEHADRVVLLDLYVGAGRSRMTEAQVIEIQRRSRSLDRVEAYASERINWRRRESTISVLGRVVTPRLIELADMVTLAGRGFDAADGVRGSPPVVIVSERLWQRELGSEPDVLGRTLTLRDVPRTVIGVMRPPPSELDVDLWIPRSLEADGDWGPTAVAWLRPGVGIDEARAELARIGPELVPDRFAAAQVRVARFGERPANSIDRMLIIFWSASAFVLVIVCANLANVLLARNIAGQRELAIRTALGASRTRIVRVLLAESALLAIAGGAGGVFVSIWSTSALLALRPVSLSFVYPQEVPLDGTALVYSVVAALLAGLAIGLAPAIRSARANPLHGITRDDPHVQGGLSARWLFGGAVVAQSALAVMLLVGAGLLFSSYVRLMRVDPGFDPDNLVALSLQLDRDVHASESGRRELFRQLADRIRSLDGVAEVAVATDAPPHSTVLGTTIAPEGRPSESSPAVDASWVHVSPGYFRVLGIPILDGRSFTGSDGRNGEVIVSDSFARKYWPQQSAIGRRFRLRRDAEWRPSMTIVGVAEDVTGRGLRDELDEVYLPYSTSRAMSSSVVARVDGQPEAYFQAIKEQVWALDPNLPIGSIRTGRERLARSIDEQPFYATLLGAFALISLVLAAVGVFGVTSYAASQRKHEMAIRIALGARAHDVEGFVLRQGVTPAIAGTVIGLAGAAALSRIMQSLVYEVSVTDPGVYGATAATLAAVALAATWIPARQASRVDPLIVLRSE